MDQLTTGRPLFPGLLSGIGHPPAPAGEAQHPLHQSGALGHDPSQIFLPPSLSTGESSHLSGGAQQFQTLGTLSNAWTTSLGGHLPPLGSTEDLRLSSDNELMRRAFLAEERDPNATIAVIDTFDTHGQGPQHGEGMEAVLGSQGFTDENIQRYSAPLSGMFGAKLNAYLENPKHPIGERIDNYVEEYTTGYINRTTGVLNGIAEDPAQIKVINESRGTSRENSMFALELAAFQTDERGQEVLDAQGNPTLTPLGQEMMSHFGLEPGNDEATIRQFRQNLVDRVDHVTSNSDRISAAQDGMSAAVDRLGQQGISYVTAAGNDGHLQERYAEEGIAVPDTWDDSLTAPENAFVVGASDTTRPQTEQAYFSSQYANVDALAPGVEVASTDIYGTGPQSGSSASSPHAAGMLETLRVENPHLSPQQLQSMLANSGTQISGTATPALH